MLLSRLISAGLFGDVIKALKPLMDIWGALGDDANLRLQHVAAFHLLTVPSISQGSFLKLLGQASAVRDCHILLQNLSKDQALRNKSCIADGLRGFTSHWLLRIIGMPVFFMIIILLYWIYDKRTNPDKDQPYVNAISHLFFAVFFCVSGHLHHDDQA